MKEVENKSFNLTLRERVKGFFLAIFGSVLAALDATKQTGHFPTTWDEFQPILLSGLYVGVTYILYTFIDDSKPNVVEKVLATKKEEPEEL